MSNTTLDALCPACGGGAVYGYDMRGKWRSPYGGSYYYRCAACGQCWADDDLTEPIDTPPAPPWPVPWTLADDSTGPDDVGDDHWYDCDGRNV